MPKPAKPAKPRSMNQKRDRSLLDKLDAVSKITDPIELSPSEACEILRRYHPSFPDIKHLQDLNSHPELVADLYVEILQKLKDGKPDKIKFTGKPLAAKQFFNQFFLAIALAVRERQLVQIVFPGIDLRKTVKKRRAYIRREIIKLKKANKSKSKRRDYHRYDVEFNYYAEHTREEIQDAIQVDKATIYRKCRVEPSLDKKVWKTKSLVYSRDECLDVLCWWLSEFLPIKAIKEPDFPLKAGSFILRVMLYEQDLLEDAKQIVTNKIIAACGPKALVWASPLSSLHQY